MSKFIFSLMCVGFFAFFYLGVFSSNVEAGAHSIAPPLANCTTSGPSQVCSGVTSATPCDGTNSICLCTTTTISGTDCLGTDGDDIMCGTSANETFRSGEGDDIICAGGGADFLHGGWGCDDLQGEAGNDVLRGGHCADRHNGGNGTDDCYGGWGFDIIESCGGTEKPGQSNDHKKDRGCGSDFCQGL